MLVKCTDVESVYYEHLAAQAIRGSEKKVRRLLKQLDMLRKEMETHPTIRTFIRQQFEGMLAETESKSP